MMKILTLIILFHIPAYAIKFVSFKTQFLYRIEGSREGNYFLVNRGTGNEQRIKLISPHHMIDGAQYAICLKFTHDCHMECSAKVVGTPSFITPNIDPKNLIPDSRGSYAPADSAQCP